MVQGGGGGGVGVVGGGGDVAGRIGGFDLAGEGVVGGGGDVGGWVGGIDGGFSAFDDDIVGVEGLGEEGEEEDGEGGEEGFHVRAPLGRQNGKARWRGAIVAGWQCVVPGLPRVLRGMVARSLSLPEKDIGEVADSIYPRWGGIPEESMRFW